MTYTWWLICSCSSCSSRITSCKGISNHDIIIDNRAVLSLTSYISYTCRLVYILSTLATLDLTSDDTDRILFNGTGAIYSTLDRGTFSLDQACTNTLLAPFDLSRAILVTSRLHFDWSVFPGIFWPTCDRIMAEVVRSNFPVLLPLIEECISKSDFLG